MKRFFAVLLTVMMLVALLPANAMVSATSVTVKPFYNINGKDLWEPEEYVYSKPFFYTSSFKPGETPTVSCYGTSKVETLAQKLKEDFDNRPEGTRYINLNLMSRAVHCLVEHNVYYDKAVEVVRNWINEFFTEYKRIGGQLDGVTLDVEYFFGGSWYIHLAAYGKNEGELYDDPDIFRSIVEDPRYLTQIRPMLEEHGFEFYPESKQTEKKTEIYSLDTRYSKAYNVWNNVNNIRMAQAIDEAVYLPLLQYYPDAIVTDYQVRYTTGWQKAVGSTSSAVSCNLQGCGNASNYNAYSVRPNKDVYAGDYTTPAACYYTAYEPTAFNTCRWEVNMLKDAYEASPSKRVSVHMTYFNYSPTKVGTYSNTPYYTENYFHIAMLDPQPIMSYVIDDEVFNNGQNFSDPNIEDYGYNIKVINDIMAEMTRVAGSSDRKPIFVPADWNSKFLLSGMYAGGRNIWRITPDTSTGVSLEEFKVKDKAPTFSIGGQTITFPQGRIIEDGNVRQVGTCGYWVETPADVMPVITNDDNRFSIAPAFLETFEQYEAGSFSAVALPKDCWEITGNATVGVNGSDKALALSGSSNVKLVKLPKNVTAGDVYAKQQAWEAAVTIPESGSVIVLNASDNEKGVKIVDGKVYYPENNQYKELTGVTVAAGSTYTIRREFDFRTNKAFTCTYTVLDASGKKLGGVENVALANVAIPVDKVGFYATSVTGAVYIDDIKLYPTGVTANLEAYNASTGYKLDGLTSDKDAGYRLSWLNASTEYKIAKIYNNGNLVEEIKMAPGQDGVATGVVQGSNIKLSVTVENGTAPAATNYDKGNFAWTSVAKTIGLATAEPANTGNSDETTENPDVTTPSGESDATTPGGNDATEPGKDNPGNQSGENKPGAAEPSAQQDSTVVILIIVLAVLLLCIGGFALYILVIKPKKEQ